MNRRLFGVFGVLAVVAYSVGGCKSDPLSDLDGNPAAIVTNFSYLQMPIGGTAAINARVLDGRATALAVPITFTPCSAAVTVATDTAYHAIPPTSAQVIVTAVSAAPSCVVIAGGGIQDTVNIAILPVAFTGGSSTATPMVGQPFSLYGNANLGFDTATAQIDFGGGIMGDIIRRVGDTLTIRVPQPDAAQPATVTVEGVSVKYVPGLVTSLTAGPFTVASPFAHVSGGAAAFVVPADGDSTVFYDGFPSGADGATNFIDYFYPFTIASTDTITFTVSWNSGADLDFAVCNGVFSGCTGGFGGATGANPETITVIFPAGNYNLFIESFDDHDAPAHLFKVVVKNP